MTMLTIYLPKMKQGHNQMMPSSGFNKVEFPFQASQH